MIPGVATSNPTAAESAAIFAFMALPPRRPDTFRLCASARALWEFLPELSMTTRFQLVQLALELLVVRIKLHGFLETLDLIVLVVLLRVRLRHGGIRRRVVWIDLRVRLQEGQRIVRLVGVDKTVGRRHEARLVEVGGLLAKVAVLLNGGGGARLRRRLGERVGGDPRHRRAAMTRGTPQPRDVRRGLAGHLRQLRADLTRHQDHFSRDDLFRISIRRVIGLRTLTGMAERASALLQDA